MSEERRFSREFKLAVLRRMLAGENVSALARELGLRRKYLYQWRERLRAGGPEALRSRGRPTKAEALAISAHGAGGPRDKTVPQVDRALPDALTKAQRRIAELERKVGQQQVDLDFFQRALRLMDATPPNGTAPTSSRSSKR